MKTNIKHEELGQIVYEESFWTGKKNLTINGKPVTKISKDTFQTEDQKVIKLEGNFIYGTKARIGETTIEFTPKIKWYEIALSILPFIFIMVWGNVVALCKILPVVGGAIGGGISGLMSIINLLVIKGIKQLWLKILISVVMLGVTILICYLIAILIISAM